MINYTFFNLVSEKLVLFFFILQFKQEKIKERFLDTFESWQNLLQEAAGGYDLLDIETRVQEDSELLLNAATNLIDENTETIQEIEKHEKSAKEDIQKMTTSVEKKRRQIKRFKVNIFVRLSKRRLKKRIVVIQEKLLENESLKRNANKEIKFCKCLLRELRQESEMVQLQVEEKKKQLKNAPCKIS